jgi:tetratricopeptide (TPR) repeat protein
MIGSRETIASTRDLQSNERGSECRRDALPGVRRWFWFLVLFFQIAELAVASFEASVSGFTAGVKMRFSDETGELMAKGIEALNQKHYDEAIAHFSDAIHLFPVDPTAYCCRALAFAGKGEYDKAISDCDQAMHLGPHYARAYSVRGQVHVKRGDLDKALADYSRAIGLFTTDPTDYAARAQIFIQKGKYEEAIADCGEAIRLNPNRAGLYSIKAGAFYARGEWDKTIIECGNAIRLDPNVDAFYGLRASAHYAAGDFDKALEDCRETVRLSPDSARACNNLAWLLAVCPDARLRDGKKAVEYARKACELNGWEGPHYLGTYAAACAETGDFDSAVKWQRKSLESNLPAAEAEQARQRLRLYEQERPFHETRESVKSSATCKSP